MKTSRYELAGLKCVEVAPDSPDANTPLVICMHGRGDQGESYRDVAPVVSQNYRFVFPTAPLTLQGAMFEWFRFNTLNIATNAAAARPLITKLIDELKSRYNVSAKNVALGGFSQGGMMAFEAGLRYPETLGGIFALSTFIVADANFNWANPKDTTYYSRDTGSLVGVLDEFSRHQTPVFVAHGTYDEVISVFAGKSTHDLLQKAGVQTEYYEFNGGHEFSPDELKKLKGFLGRIFV